MPAAHLRLLGWLSPSALRARAPRRKIAWDGEALLEEKEAGFEAELEEPAACRGAARLERHPVSSSELEG